MQDKQVHQTALDLFQIGEMSQDFPRDEVEPAGMRRELNRRLIPGHASIEACLSGDGNCQNDFDLFVSCLREFKRVAHSERLGRVV